MRIRPFLASLLIAGFSFTVGFFARPRLNPLAVRVYERVKGPPRPREVPRPASMLSGAEPLTMPAPRFEPGVAVAGGRLYLFSGFYDEGLHATERSDMFDPASGVWTQMASVPVAVTHAGLAVLGDEIWIAGGFTGHHPGPAGRAVWRYHIPGNEWRAGPLLPEARGAGGLVNVEGTLHYFGGLKPDRQTDSSDHWSLAPGAAVWEHRAPLPVAVNHFSAILLDGRVHLLGGQHGHDVSFQDVALHQVYDPARDSWSSAAPLPRARSHTEPGTFLLDGRIVQVGGRSNEIPVLYDIAAYDGKSDTWRTLPGLPVPMRAPVARVLGPWLYAGSGGVTSSGIQPTPLWYRFPASALGASSR